MSGSLYEMKTVDYKHSLKRSEYDEVWIGLRFKFVPPPNFVIGIRWTQYSQSIPKKWEYSMDNEIGDTGDKQYKGKKNIL